MSDAFVEMRCWNCDVAYGMNRRIYERRKEDGGNFFCTNGHSAVFRESEADKLRRERDRLRQDAARLEEECREAEARATRAENAAKRLKKRAATGSCPCCKRTFSNMATHIRQKHPEFVCENVVQMKRPA